MPSNSQYLFGDDIAKQLKYVKGASKISRSVTNPPNKKLPDGNYRLSDQDRVGSVTTVINLETGIFFMEKPVQTVQAPETTGPKDRQQIIERVREIRNSVSVFEQFLPSLLSHLQDSRSNFRAGCIASNLVAWTEITNDKEVLSEVSGVHIDCIEGAVQHWLPPQKFDDHD